MSSFNKKIQRNSQENHGIVLAGVKQAPGARASEVGNSINIIPAENTTVKNHSTVIRNENKGFAVPEDDHNNTNQVNSTIDFGGVTINISHASDSDPQSLLTDDSNDSSIVFNRNYALQLPPGHRRSRTVSHETSQGRGSSGEYTLSDNIELKAHQSQMLELSSTKISRVETLPLENVQLIKDGDGISSFNAKSRRKQSQENMQKLNKNTSSEFGLANSSSKTIASLASKTLKHSGSASNASPPSSSALSTSSCSRLVQRASQRLGSTPQQNKIKSDYRFQSKKQRNKKHKSEISPASSIELHEVILEEGERKAGSVLNDKGALHQSSLDPFDFKPFGQGNCLTSTQRDNEAINDNGNNQTDYGCIFPSRLGRNGFGNSHENDAVLKSTHSLDTLSSKDSNTNNSSNALNEKGKNHWDFGIMNPTDNSKVKEINNRSPQKQAFQSQDSIDPINLTAIVSDESSYNHWLTVSDDVNSDTDASFKLVNRNDDVIQTRPDKMVVKATSAVTEQSRITRNDLSMSHSPIDEFRLSSHCSHNLSIRNSGHDEDRKSCLKREKAIPVRTIERKNEMRKEKSDLMDQCKNENNHSDDYSYESVHPDLLNKEIKVDESDSKKQSISERRLQEANLSQSFSFSFDDSADNSEGDEKKDAEHFRKVLLGAFVDLFVSLDDESARSGDSESITSDGQDEGRRNRNIQKQSQKEGEDKKDEDDELQIVSSLALLEQWCKNEITYVVMKDLAIGHENDEVEEETTSQTQMIEEYLNSEIQRVFSGDDISLWNAELFAQRISRNITCQDKVKKDDDSGRQQDISQQMTERSFKDEIKVQSSNDAEAETDYRLKDWLQSLRQALSTGEPCGQLANVDTNVSDLDFTFSKSFDGKATILPSKLENLLSHFRKGVNNSNTTPGTKYSVNENRDHIRESNIIDDEMDLRANLYTSAKDIDGDSKSRFTTVLKHGHENNTSKVVSPDRLGDEEDEKNISHLDFTFSKSFDGKSTILPTKLEMLFSHFRKGVNNSNSISGTKCCIIPESNFSDSVNEDVDSNRDAIVIQVEMDLRDNHQGSAQDIDNDSKSRFTTVLKHGHEDTSSADQVVCSERIKDEWDGKNISDLDLTFSKSFNGKSTILPTKFEMFLSYFRKGMNNSNTMPGTKCCIISENNFSDSVNEDVNHSIEATVIVAEMDLRDNHQRSSKYIDGDSKHGHEDIALADQVVCPERIEDEWDDEAVELLQTSHTVVEPRRYNVVGKCSLEHNDSLDAFLSGVNCSYENNDKSFVSLTSSNNTTNDSEQSYSTLSKRELQLESKPPQTPFSDSSDERTIDFLKDFSDTKDTVSREVAETRKISDEPIVHIVATPVLGAKTVKLTNLKDYNTVHVDKALQQDIPETSIPKTGLGKTVADPVRVPFPKMLYSNVKGNKSFQTGIDVQLLSSNAGYKKRELNEQSSEIKSQTAESIDAALIEKGERMAQMRVAALNNQRGKDSTLKENKVRIIPLIKSDESARNFNNKTDSKDICEQNRPKLDRFVSFDTRHLERGLTSDSCDQEVLLEALVHNTSVEKDFVQNTSGPEVDSQSEVWTELPLKERVTQIENGLYRKTRYAKNSDGRLKKSLFIPCDQVETTFDREFQFNERYGTDLEHQTKGMCQKKEKISEHQNSNGALMARPESSQDALADRHVENAIEDVINYNTTLEEHQNSEEDVVASIWLSRETTNDKYNPRSYGCEDSKIKYLDSTINLGDPQDSTDDFVASPTASHGNVIKSDNEPELFDTDLDKLDSLQSDKNKHLLYNEFLSTENSVIPDTDSHDSFFLNYWERDELYFGPDESDKLSAVGDDEKNKLDAEENFTQDPSFKEEVLIMLAASTCDELIEKCNHQEESNADRSVSPIDKELGNYCSVKESAEYQHPEEGLVMFTKSTRGELIQENEMRDGMNSDSYESDDLKNDEIKLLDFRKNLKEQQQSVNNLLASAAYCEDKTVDKCNYQDVHCNRLIEFVSLKNSNIENTDCSKNLEENQNSTECFVASDASCCGEEPNNYNEKDGFQHHAAKTTVHLKFEKDIINVMTESSQDEFILKQSEHDQPVFKAFESSDPLGQDMIENVNHMKTLVEHQDPIDVSTASGVLSRDEVIEKYKEQEKLYADLLVEPVTHTNGENQNITDSQKSEVHQTSAMDLTVFATFNRNEFCEKYNEPDTIYTYSFESDVFNDKGVNICYYRNTFGEFNQPSSNNDVQLSIGERSDSWDEPDRSKHNNKQRRQKRSWVGAIKKLGKWRLLRKLLLYGSNSSNKDKIQDEYKTLIATERSMEDEYLLFYSPSFNTGSQELRGRKWNSDDDYNQNDLVMTTPLVDGFSTNRKGITKKKKIRIPVIPGVVRRANAREQNEEPDSLFISFPYNELKDDTIHRKQPKKSKERRKEGLPNKESLVQLGSSGITTTETDDTFDSFTSFISKQNDEGWDTSTISFGNTITPLV